MGCFLQRSDYSQKAARVEGEFYTFSIGCYLFLKILLIFHMCLAVLYVVELGHLQTNHLIYTNVQNSSETLWCQTAAILLIIILEVKLGVGLVGLSWEGHL